MASSPTITPVLCAGTPRDIGYAQGLQTRDHVQACLGALKHLEAFQLMRPPWMPHSIFLRLAERRASQAFNRSIMGEGVPERVIGIASGANMRPASISLLNILEPMMSDLRDVTDVPPLGGCSAIGVGATRSSSGECVITRNFDYVPIVQPYFMMRDTRPKGGLRSLDFTVAPLAGAPDGINEAGLCIVCNYAYVTDPATRAAPITMAISEALGVCTTVAEATEFLIKRPRWGGGLLMLADASGDMASLELSNSRSALRGTDSGSGVIFHTNRFQSESMRDVELHRDAVFTKKAPTTLRGKIVHRSAQTRFSRIAELIGTKQQIEADDLVSILADHGPDQVPSEETPCVHSNYWVTTATLQFFPASRRVRVAFDSACRAQFTELELTSS